MKKEQANFKVASKQALLATMLVSGFLAGLPESAFAHVNEVNVVQQGKVVKGQVVDSNGEPIIGATIKEKGTKNGVVTDLDGNFVLDNVSERALVVSYIGYKTQDNAFYVNTKTAEIELTNSQKNYLSGNRILPLESFPILQLPLKKEEIADGIASVEYVDSNDIKMFFNSK